MRKVAFLAFSVTVVVAAAFLADVRSARAVPQFRKEFVTKYVKPDSTAAKDKAFAEAVAKARCNVCHAGPDKEKRNPYGQALSKFVTTSDQEDRKKVLHAFDKAATMKPAPKSPTFGERISAGKLPCDVVE